MTSWWFQPTWKICSSKWDQFPRDRGEHKKCLSCHYPVTLQEVPSWPNFASYIGNLQLHGSSPPATLFVRTNFQEKNTHNVDGSEIRRTHSGCTPNPSFKKMVDFNHQPQVGSWILPGSSWTFKDCPTKIPEKCRLHPRPSGGLNWNWRNLIWLRQIQDFWMKISAANWPKTPQKMNGWFTWEYTFLEIQKIIWTQTIMTSGSNC